MSLTKEYKCPHCGGALTFDTATQKLVCPFCDSIIEVDDYSDDLKEQQGGSKKKPEPEQKEQLKAEDGFVSYVCQSCGGEIITQENEGSFRCPYCGNTIVSSAHFSGMAKPKYIIPFQQDKASAIQALQQHFKGNWFLPKDFAFRHKVESILGVYVPFWLYDCTLTGTMSFHATKVTTWQDHEYRYTKTDFYQVTRDGNMVYEHLPQDGSSKFSDAMMKSIEPFAFDKMIPFEMGYLAGYSAQRYDVDAQENMAKIESGIKQQLSASLRNSANGYHTCTPSGEQIAVSSMDAEYALLPVWMLSSTYKDEIYTFAMNGQTGKFVGNLPMDKKKYWSIFVLIAMVSALVIFLICKGVMK